MRDGCANWAPPNVWSMDGGWYRIDRPYDSGRIHYPGSVLWLPTLRGSPDFTDNWTQEFPRSFEAVLSDCCLSGEVSYQWSSWGINVYFSEPTARVTGAEFRGFDFSGWYSPWMSVEANVCGYTLRSDVYIDDIPPDARQVSVTFAGSSHVWVDHPQDDANGRTWTVCIDSPVPTCGVFRVSYAGSSVHARVDFVGPQEIEIDESTTYPLERVLAVVKGIAPSDHCGEESFRWSFEGLDGVLVGTNRFTVCRVDAVELRLQKDGASVDPVSFPGQETAMFSITNSASPDRHYPIFFENVVDENARLLPYSVAYRVCLSPAEFELADAMTSLTLIDGPDSGTLRAAMGKTGYFDTPCEGGVYRIGVRYADSPPTETILLLPIAGASVDMVIEDDIERADEAVVYMMANYSAVQRQMPIFGLQWFNNDGMGDYLGRVDAIARPTEWLYNQVNDDTRMGAVATWCGSPVRMSKASNFLVGYTTRRLGVWGASRWMSQMIGTGNDESASMSWRAGVAVAESAVYDSTVRNMVTNAWKVSDRKERRLWPNLTPTDNHTSWHGISNFNYQFISPGFTERRPR